jgi:hypothetical protein
MRSLAKIVTLATVVSVSCTGAPEAPAEARPSGPPRIRPSVVARHAREFDEDLARRAPGSQGEAAAATYILGHLQRAGYLVRLVAVPVADLVSSLDLVALPPGAATPSAVVAVAYDSASPPRLFGGPAEPAPRAGAGAAIGLFLELGRALNAADTRHDVELVALGAEHARMDGGGLGSRRLVGLLEESGDEPLIVTIEAGGDVPSGRVRVLGTLDGLPAAARALGIRIVPAPGASEADGVASTRHRLFSAAGLQHAGVWGAAEDLGPLLLEYLLHREPS